MANRDVVVRASQVQPLAQDWALVLAAAGIPHALEPNGGGWCVRVAEHDAARAAAALDAYDRERLATAAAEAEPSDHGRTFAGVVVAVLLLASHALITSGAGPRDWYAAGSANAAAILRGEWWRTVTALTLHANWSHVANNAVAGAIFFTAVCRSYGSGVGLTLVLLSGTAGNALNALLRGAPHDSIGASTAVFGAIGVLAGTMFARRRDSARARRRAWLPVAAGLALLALLGTAEQSDIVAHLFGFGAGVPLGTVATRWHAARGGRTAQWGLMLCAVLVVLGCWAMAIG